MYPVLEENGIKSRDASSYVRDKGKDPIPKGGVACRYFARCVAKGPDEGMKVCSDGITGVSTILTRFYRSP